VPATNPLRTLCDLGAVAPQAVPDVLTTFMIAGYVRPDVVKAAVDRHSSRGRSGIGALRLALAGLPLGSKPPDSILEPAVADLLRRYALPEARFHAIVAGYEVDFHFESTPVILESDGWATHGLDREQFERDREKDAVLRAAGYMVCRFTWRQITERPSWTAERLRETLLRWAPGVVGIRPSEGVVG
jgi:very-short-patch-repair endonuclease